MKSLNSLPRPDRYGNYWFRSREAETAPAIFQISEPEAKGDWYVSLGEEGMIWERSPEGEIRLKLFNDPERALRELRALLKTL
jgi:hypothetical protein